MVPKEIGGGLDSTR